MFYKSHGRPDGLCPQCKNCMKANAAARRASGQERIIQREWRKKVRNKPSFRASRLLADSKSRNKGEFDLTLEWLTAKLEAGHCEITGLPFDTTGDGAPARAFAPSLDRTDSSLGYTQDNTKVVVWIYNRAKGVQSHKEVMILANALVAHNDN